MRDKITNTINNRIVLMAIGCIILYWIAESVIMFLVFHEGGLIEQMLSPHPHEIWMRSTAICLFIIFGGYSWLMFAGRRRAEEALQNTHDELEVKVAERTAELGKANEELLDYQQRLRSLDSRLSLAEENERRRIAVDLHDSVGQSLSLCKMRLEILEQSMSSDELVEYVSSTLDMVDHTIQYVRSLTFELSSPILYDLGIEAAIEDLLDNYQNKHGILTRFKDDEQPIPLGNDIGIFIFRSVQELLINVLKHAQAHSIEVAIWRRNGDICVSVEDDGVGFQVPEDGTPRQRRNDGFGLFGISERMSYLGGSAEIRSEPGTGTRVVLQIPLEENTESEEGGTA